MVYWFSLWCFFELDPKNVTKFSGVDFSMTLLWAFQRDFSHFPLLATYLKPLSHGIGASMTEKEFIAKCSDVVSSIAVVESISLSVGLEFNDMSFDKSSRKSSPSLYAWWTFNATMTKTVEPTNKTHKAITTKILGLIFMTLKFANHNETKSEEMIERLFNRNRLLRKVNI